MAGRVPTGCTHLGNKRKINDLPDGRGRSHIVMARTSRIGVKISLEFAAIGSDLRIDANFLDNVSTMAGGAGPPAA
jgi:hypothetical protein